MRDETLTSNPVLQHDSPRRRRRTSLTRYPCFGAAKLYR